MSQYIVLLSSPHDARFLSAILLSHNPGLAITMASTPDQLEARVLEAPAGARLSEPAHNFHPAPRAMAPPPTR